MLHSPFMHFRFSTPIISSGIHLSLCDVIAISGPQLALLQYIFPLSVSRRPGKMLHFVPNKSYPNYDNAMIVVATHGTAVNKTIISQ